MLRELGQEFERGGRRKRENLEDPDGDDLVIVDPVCPDPRIVPRNDIDDPEGIDFDEDEGLFF